jgi:ribosomal protein S27AE
MTTKTERLADAVSYVLRRNARCDRCGHAVTAHHGMVGECHYGSCTCPEFAEEESVIFLAEEVTRLRAENHRLDTDRMTLVARIKELEADLRRVRSELYERVRVQGPLPDVRGSAYRERYDGGRPSTAGFDGND